MTENVNTYVEQVGGQHYQADYQLWDLCFDVPIGPLEFCAARYVQRWRSKNGKEDLQKAKSYLEKILVVDSVKSVKTQGDRFTPYLNIAASIQRYLSNINTKDKEILHLILTWDSRGDLEKALAMINGLISSQEE